MLVQDSKLLDLHDLGSARGLIDTFIQNISQVFWCISLIPYILPQGWVLYVNIVLQIDTFYWY